jgi:hypothetical protein
MEGEVGEQDLNIVIDIAADIGNDIIVDAAGEKR